MASIPCDPQTANQTRCFHYIDAIEKKIARSIHMKYKLHYNPIKEGVRVYSF